MSAAGQSQPTLLQGQTDVALLLEHAAPHLDIGADRQSTSIELVDTGKPEAGKVDFPDGGSHAASAAPERVQTNAASSNFKRSPNQVEKSQGSFATLHKLLHGFTPSKLPKGVLKKGPMLTIAQVQQLSAVPVATDSQADVQQRRACRLTQSQTNLCLVC